jgi:hypothetical protein
MNVWMLQIHSLWSGFFHCRAGVIAINATHKQASSHNNSRSTTTWKEANQREGKGEQCKYTKSEREQEEPGGAWGNVDNGCIYH